MQCLPEVQPLQSMIDFPSLSFWARSWLTVGRCCCCCFQCGDCYCFTGDNEWTDCDRSNAFGATFNSLNRLSLIRQLFFNNNPLSANKKKLKQEVQVC